jgi:hypothetical protein
LPHAPPSTASVQATAATAAIARRFMERPSCGVALRGYPRIGV